MVKHLGKKMVSYGGIKNTYMGRAFDREVYQYALFGEAAPATLTPTQAESLHKPGEVVVYGMSDPPFVFPPQVCDLLEELEPGVHEFLPTEVYNSRRREPYFFVKAPPVVDCIIIEETDFSHGHGQEAYDRAYHESLKWNPDRPRVRLDGSYSRVVVDGSSIRGHHLWFPGPAISFEYMISDVLANRLKALRVKGIECEDRYLVRQPDGSIH